MSSSVTIAIKDRLKLAREVAEETYGANPPPEIVAALLNAITAQGITSQLECMTVDLCRAAAVAGGD